MHAETCLLLFFVGRTANEIDEIWQEISRRRSVRTWRNMSD